MYGVDMRIFLIQALVVLAKASTSLVPGAVVKCRDSSFEIRNLLGKGRNSVVFRALAADGLEVAVKAREDGTDAEGQLSREAEVLTALDASEGFPRIVCATESCHGAVVRLPIAGPL